MLLLANKVRLSLSSRSPALPGARRSKNAHTSALLLKRGGFPLTAPFEGMDHAARAESTQPLPGAPTVAKPSAAFLGLWRNDQTEGLDEFLRTLGVGWARRKIAASFRPTTSWTWTGDALQAATRTPLGERRETFALEAKAPPGVNRKGRPPAP